MIAGSDLGFDLHSSPLLNGTIFLGEEFKAMLRLGSSFRRSIACAESKSLGKSGVLVWERKDSKVSGRSCVSRGDASSVGLVKDGS